jgi:excisionase family DNA binding protein
MWRVRVSDSAGKGVAGAALPDEPIEGPRAYTINEVATLLSVHRNTVQRWVSAGELPAVRLGYHVVRIRREDLEAFLAARAYRSA